MTPRIQVQVVPEEREKTKEKKSSKMEAFHAREGERAACMTFLRDTITRISDKSNLQKAQIETLLSERVSVLKKKIILSI